MISTKIILDEQQKNYGLRSLSLLNTYFAKDILYLSLRKKDGQNQQDNNLGNEIWATNKRFTKKN